MTALERLRAVVNAMTDAPWFDRGRLVSRVPDNTGMGATMHTNQIANSASLEDSAGIVALRNAAPALLDLADACDRHEVDGGGLPPDVMSALLKLRGDL